MSGATARGRIQRSGARVLGWLRRRGRRAREPHGLVLMYHRVASPRADPWRLAVTPERFASQIGTLREHVDFVPLAELRRQLRSGRQSRPVVAITFDDGYADNLTTARPILERFGAPATVFLATGQIGRRGDYWWDRLAKLLLHGGGLPATLELAVGSDVFHCEDRRLAAAGARGARARRLLHDRLWEWLHDRQQDLRAGALDELAAWSGVSPAPDPGDWPLSPEQVRELAHGGLVEIGAHTVNHPMLSRLARADQAFEIRQSRADCRRLSGRDPMCFAFPNGDFDSESPALVREAGFAFACTSRQDLVWSTGDAYAMPRMVVPDVSGAALLFRLQRYWLG